MNLTSVKSIRFSVRKRSIETKRARTDSAKCLSWFKAGGLISQVINTRFSFTFNLGRIIEAVQFEACLMVDGFRRGKTLLEAIDQKLAKERVKFRAYEYLLTIPGFGPTIATMTLGAIRDPNRFENGRQVLKLAGLDLSANRSGQSSLKANTRISKKGKAELRYALYHAALTASSRHKFMKSWFESKIKKREKEKGIGMKTRIKLSAKLLIIA